MEIQNVIDYCLNQNHKKCRMSEFLEKRKNGIELSESEIESMRFSCASCRSFGKTGIYKADAIMSALELHQQSQFKNKNIGKKPTRKKQYGTAIKNLREQGKTIREIAEILGISKTTVHKIIKSF